VTHLLVATKQLLETLTKWSRHEASDTNVSDVYVRLGYEFNIACRAFAAINVDTSDLGNVPELLRSILESTLSQEASPESLDRFLPKIRDIIITLLHGLKRKQQRLRQQQSKETRSQSSDPNMPRISSASSVGSGNTGLTSMLNEGIGDNYSEVPRADLPESRDSRVPTEIDRTSRNLQSLPESEGIPPRGSSMSAGSPVRRAMPPRQHSEGSLASSDHSTISSTTMQSMPVVPPYPGDESTMPTRPGSEDLGVDSFPPPPPPPKTQNALMALQRGGDLERRASRRYSAYQISKHLGSMPMPMLPSQNSPIPNRGRDLRESMNAVRGRGSNIHLRQRSNPRVVTDGSPSRVSSRISEENSGQAPILKAPETNGVNDSPLAKTPEDKLRQPPVSFEQSDDALPTATLRGPPTDALPMLPDGSPKQRKKDLIKETENSVEFSPPRYSAVSPETSQATQFVPEHSPQPGKELTLFLQYKTKIKKFVLADGYNELSMARLQLAFIEKFAWNTHNNGVDLPEIYIQDPVSGVRHELEDLNDIKDRSVLVLNVEVLDEVKRHIDDGIGGLKLMVEGVKTALDDQKTTIQRVSERQQDTIKEVARLAAAPPAIRTSSETPRSFSPTKGGSIAQITEIQGLRRDLAVLRQTYSSFQSDIENSMSAIRSKASSVKSVAVKASIPDMKGDAGRSYVNAGKKTLNEDSDKLVGQVDDLQDIVEDLRKDVVLRGVRPLPRQLENVAKDISVAAMELRKMQEFLKRERPIWTKIWEKELETVCNDREELTMQEDLATDLQDDLEKAQQTFALVEEATKEQMKDAPPGAIVPSRVLSRGLSHVPKGDPGSAKEGVLDEVRALQPNHEGRVEAIERAAKLRQKELEGRKGGEFQKELGNFVEEGKLKKAGGFEEVERLRKLKDEQVRREVWERQNGMTQADGAAEPVPVPVAEEEIILVDEDEANGVNGGMM
jgi:hypothetical protein